MKPKISLQLWSVQDACKEDFLGTLTKVKEQGYDAVEFAGYYDVDATTLKNHLDQLGLVVSGSHIQFSQLKDHLAETIAFEKTIGNQNIIVPFFQGEDLATWQELFTLLKEVQPELSAAGLTLGYHNHAHEFTQIEGVNLLEEMLTAVPGLHLEVDTYWVAYAGIDPVEWMSKHASVINCLHIKEMHKVAEVTESTEIGTGILPIKTYVEFAKNQGIKWLVVEQEAFQAYTPMESAALNVKALEKIVNEVYV